jgi:hypothetical protein
VWSAVLDGQRLTFRLSGINNQNFVMRDEQTGTWWQQVSGLAIKGPLKGRRLTHVPHDELLFATWKEEPVGQDRRAHRQGDEYEPADWEDHVGDIRSASPTCLGTARAAHDRRRDRHRGKAGGRSRA